jgi:hypothetical protein
MAQIEIKSRKGTFFTIPDEAVDKIGGWGWCQHPAGHVMAHLPKSGGISKTVQLAHAVIWAVTGEWPPTGMEVDHINNDPLDNRMENLRIVTCSGNKRNMKKQEGTASKLQGVFWNKLRQKWIAKAGIRINGKMFNIWSSHTPDEILAGKCADVIRLLIGGWHESKLNNPELTFFDKWYHIGKGQQEQILHSMAKNNVPIDPLSAYRQWYRAA